MFDVIGVRIVNQRPHPKFVDRVRIGPVQHVDVNTVGATIIRNCKNTDTSNKCYLL